MKPAHADRAFSFGCLLVFTGMVFFGYLAVNTRWTYSAAVVGLMIFWLIIARIRLGRLHRRNMKALNDIFADSGIPIPLLKEGGSYGYSSFVLMFRSEADMNNAGQSGRIDAFKQALQTFYGHQGRAGNPFDVNCALQVKYGDYDRWLSELTAS